ncbi:DNA starvation/stationary phase protection protein [Roseococcus sp. SYP-B2431]|uniref:Dps family protein n=1 Tax=Roseococcus sp. SYP-B2431 TaxID=2496640 RepID=UPI00103F2615|nr:DNA starvation/stationary phase protection protein [Roseococcus sp. SYP-B2431]TCH99555.1 DNA starvation/stationary phase protection protein [Roseococcus sp. SYP-B2431]
MPSDIKTKKGPASNKAEAGVGASLNGFLADTYVLLAKTQACHWNAKGPNFYGLHKLTEAQYGELFEAIDELAERVRALDVPAPGGLNAMLQLAKLEEAPDGLVSTVDAARMLAEDNATLAARASELAEEADDAGDQATNDMLVARIEVHEKAAWLLRSHLG